MTHTLVIANLADLVCLLATRYVLLGRKSHLLPLVWLQFRLRLCRCLRLLSLLLLFLLLLLLGAAMMRIMRTAMGRGARHLLGLVATRDHRAGMVVVGVVVVGVMVVMVTRRARTRRRG